MSEDANNEQLKTLYDFAVTRFVSEQARVEELHTRLVTQINITNAAMALLQRMRNDQLLRL